MKKVLVIVLTGMFLVSALAPAALADSRGHEKKEHKVKWEQNLKIKDVKGHWAESVLLEMNAKGFVKGYQDDTFKPSNVVSNLEAVVMLVRSMGLEDEAKEAELTVNVKHAKQIPAWAAGYVQVAYEKGILTDNDLKSFNPNQGAKRVKVALWINRALDLDQKMECTIVLKFADNKEIPLDFSDVVKLMVQTGIMKGTPGNCFLPNKSITRAEMAVLLDRIDGTVPEIAVREIKGKISSVDDDSITITKARLTKEFSLEEDVIIYLDGEAANIDDLKTGYQAKLIFGDDGKVAYIKASTASEEISYEGTIKQIVLGSDQQITIESNGKMHTFKINDDTEIEVDGDEVFFSELEIDQEVTVEAKGDTAIEIEAESLNKDEDEEEYEGTISEVDTGSTPSISIKDENDGKTYTFEITNDTKIVLDDDSAELDKLKDGYEVEIIADGTEALSIEAETVYQEYEGEITSITLGSNAVIVIETEDDDEITVNITDDTIIKLDGSHEDLDDLKVGDEVEIEMDGSAAVKVDAER